MAPDPAKDQSGDAVSTHLVANKSAAKFVKYYQTQVLKLPEEEPVSEFDDGELNSLRGKSLSLFYRSLIYVLENNKK